MEIITMYSGFFFSTCVRDNLAFLTYLALPKRVDMVINFTIYKYSNYLREAYNKQ